MNTTTDKKIIKAGDEVRVFDMNDRGRFPEGRPAHVISVGRTLCEIQVDGHSKVEQFRQTGEKNDAYGREYFKTMTEVDESGRARAARNVLHIHGVKLSFSCKLSVDGIEALAVACINDSSQYISPDGTPREIIDLWLVRRSRVRVTL
jgi:hypothetical protein